MDEITPVVLRARWMADECTHLVPERFGPPLTGDEHDAVVADIIESQAMKAEVLADAELIDDEAAGTVAEIDADINIAEVRLDGEARHAEGVALCGEVAPPEGVDVYDRAWFESQCTTCVALARSRTELFAIGDERPLVVAADVVEALTTFKSVVVTGPAGLNDSIPTLFAIRRTASLKGKHVWISWPPAGDILVSATLLRRWDLAGPGAILWFDPDENPDAAIPESGEVIEFPPRPADD